jgi:secreted PhoX family phosphatase
VLDMPDNITVSPQGEIVIAEDGLEGNYLRRVTRDGAVVDFARNALSSSELTGPCFAPDGQTLFVNLQRDGLTLAIRGPFDDELQRAPAAKSNSDTHASGPGFASVTAGLVTLSLAALMHRRRKLGATG